MLKKPNFSAFLFPGGPPELLWFPGWAPRLRFCERSFFLPERSLSHLCVHLQSQPIFRLPDTWPSPVLFLDPAFWPCPITSLSSVLGIEKEPRWVAPYITACVCYIKNCIKVINPNTTDKTNPTLVIASCFLLFFSFSILLSFSVFNSTAIRLTTFFPSSTF